VTGGRDLERQKKHPETIFISKSTTTLQWTEATATRPRILGKLLKKIYRSFEKNGSLVSMKWAWPSMGGNPSNQQSGRSKDGASCEVTSIGTAGKNGEGNFKLKKWGYRKKRTKQRENQILLSISGYRPKGPVD